MPPGESKHISATWAYMEQTGWQCYAPVAPQYLPVTGNRNQRKQKEPDKFEGDKVEWADFIAHFDMVARWNDWTYMEKGLQLAACLRGKAQKVLSSIPESQRSDYEAMKSALEKRFSPPSSRKRVLCHLSPTEA